MNVEEGWCRDVSDVMADKVREIAQREDMELTDGTIEFLGGARARGKAGDAAVVVTFAASWVFGNGGERERLGHV